MLSESGTPPRPRTYRLSALAYLAVVILFFGTLPLAVAGNGTRLAPPVFSPRLLLLAIPLVAAIFIRRTATIVDTEGITVRAAFGSRRQATPGTSESSAPASWGGVAALAPSTFARLPRPSPGCARRTHVAQRSSWPNP